MIRIVAVSLLFHLTGYLHACGQSLTVEEKKILHHHSKIICNDSLCSAANWKSLTNSLKGKQIILLGEPNHGSGEIFLARNKLIKQLHDELGIKTILFESGIGELATVDLMKDEWTPAQMTNGLFGGWRTEEFRELMEYVKSAHLSISGYDVQRTGNSFSYLLREVAGKKSIDTALYEQLEERYGWINAELSNRKVVYDSVYKKTNALISGYQKLYAALLKHKESDASKEFPFVIITIQNRIKYLSYMLAFAKDKDWSKRWAARDAAMAENVQWLLENMYKDERVIIIGHNFHIAKFNEEESTMGEMLAAVYGSKMYSIGAFAGSGTYHNNAGKEEKMLPPDSTHSDIKHIINALNGTVNFIDISGRRKNGDDWLNNEIIINDTFINLSNDNKMILSKNFDGLLLFDKISPSKTN